MTTTRPRFAIGGLLLATSLYFIATNAHFFYRLTRADLGKYFDLRALLLLHIAGGAVALLTGPFQFWEELRKKRRALHRALGKTYLLAIAVSSPCALYLSFATAPVLGRSYAMSLHVWASVWMVATFLAYRYATQKKFKLHEEWAARSYLVTLAFVLSALLGKVPALSELSADLFWGTWSVPLVVYDVVLSARRRQ